MSKIQLISATPSPYARKVRIALAEKGIPFELQTEVPWNSTTRTKDYNPLEKLPVLLIAGPDGVQIAKAVYESHHIMEYLEVKYGAPHYPTLVSDDADERLAAKEVEVVADGMCDACVLRFFEKMREAPRQSPEWIARQMRKLDGGMKYLASQVQPGQQYMVGGKFGLADIAAGAVCGYLDVRFAEYPWRAEYPRLAEYVDRLNARASFKETVPSPQKISDKIV